MEARIPKANTVCDFNYSLENSSLNEKCHLLYSKTSQTYINKKRRKKKYEQQQNENMHINQYSKPIIISNHIFISVSLFIRNSSQLFTFHSSATDKIQKSTGNKRRNK